MTEQTSGQLPSGASRNQVMYILPAETLEGETSPVSLLDLLRVIWWGKLIAVVIVVLATALAVVYALAATEWFRGEVLLAPAEQRTGPNLQNQLGGLGGLATLAGLRAAGGGSAEPIAVLRSRGFIAKFIEDNELMPILYAERWDSERETWLDSDGNESDPPDLRDAIEFFQDNLLNVQEETRTGLVTVSVDWTDPAIAAAWANGLVLQLNEHMRARALQEAEDNVAYLREQLAGANLVVLQQSIGSLLEAELQQLMLAQGNDEYSFRVLDPAMEPKRRVRPYRAMIVLMAVVASSLLSVIIILIWHALRFSTLKR